MATTQRFFMASLQLAGLNRSMQITSPRKRGEARVQPPIRVFDQPVKGCDLLLRLVRDHYRGAPNSLIPLKDARHPKKLIFAA
jgi:hypothetical protein